MSVLRVDDSSTQDERRSGAHYGARRAASVLIGFAALLGGTLFALALLVKRLALQYAAFGRFGDTLLTPENREAGEAIAIGVAVVLAVAAPRFGRQWFSGIERAFARFAAHRNFAILAAATLPVVARLAILPVMPIPQPFVADEFGHLLLADTFASGRIANPTHPLWPDFEALYVLHQPSYTSQYPIAQGLILAVPIALGAHPWFGVCLGIALMGAALCWMLQGWLPPRWALLGALLAGARWSVVTYWMNSYWGGAAGAIGGALLLGALARMLQRGRITDALMAGAGLFMLSQSRPFEGFLLSLPVGGLLAVRLLRRPRENIRMLTAFGGVCVMVGAGILYYDWRVTGKALQTPYQLHQSIYGTPQNLLWRAPLMDAPRAKQQRDIWDNFQWQLGLFQEQSSWQGFFKAMGDKLQSFWEFYFLPILSLPLLLLPWVLQRRPMRFLFFTAVFVLLAGFLLYPFYFSHYAAPLSGLFLVLILQSARYLRAIQWRHQRFGAALFRWGLATAGVASCSLLVLGGMLCPACVVIGVTPRSQVDNALKQKGGKHLVLVRFTPTHNFHDPWVYNSAAIDKSPVIWARELDPASVSELIHRYPDREAWLVNADEANPELVLYADKDRPQISAVLNAAGKSPFFQTGVTPGSIVTVFARRLVLATEPQTGTCLILPAQEKVRALPPATLPGFDGSRPGIEVPLLEERLPAIAMGQTSAGVGASFSLAEEHSGQRRDPTGRDVGVRFGNLPGKVLCLTTSGDVAAITVLAPPQLTGDSVSIVLRAGGFESKPDVVPVMPANPGILQVLQAATRAALVFHPGGDLVTPGNPARRGEILGMLVTGIGASNAEGPPFPLIVGVNNRGAPLRGINCAACGSGIAELRFEVPQDAPPGDQVALSTAVMAKGSTVFSNSSTLAVR